MLLNSQPISTTEQQKPEEKVGQTGDRFSEQFKVAGVEGRLNAETDGCADDFSSGNHFSSTFLFPVLFPFEIPK